MENQCWKQNNFLLSEEKFKFLVHSQDGKPWLAASEQEMSQLVEDVTKAGGFYPDEKFTVLSNISVQCQGADQWNFTSTEGLTRFGGHFNFSLLSRLHHISASAHWTSRNISTGQITSRLCPV